MIYKVTNITLEGDNNAGPLYASSVMLRLYSSL